MTGYGEETPDIVPVEDCADAPGPGIWIRPEALDDLHRAFLIEEAKRKAFERAFRAFESLPDPVAYPREQEGPLWQSWVAVGALTFTAGLVLGVYLSKAD